MPPASDILDPHGAYHLDHQAELAQDFVCGADEVPVEGVELCLNRVGCYIAQGLVGLSQLTVLALQRL